MFYSDNNAVSHQHRREDCLIKTCNWITFAQNQNPSPNRSLEKAKEIVEGLSGRLLRRAANRQQGLLWNRRKQAERS